MLQHEIHHVFIIWCSDYQNDGERGFSFFFLILSYFLWYTLYTTYKTPYTETSFEHKSQLLYGKIIIMNHIKSVKWNAWKIDDGFMIAVSIFFFWFNLFSFDFSRSNVYRWIRRTYIVNAGYRDYGIKSLIKLRFDCEDIEDSTFWFKFYKKIYLYDCSTLRVI